MKINACAIIVTFNPEKVLLFELINSLYKKCQIIIVDNGSSRQCLEDSILACKEYQCKFISLTNNFGIAKAQNEGIKHVERNMPSINYLAFFDQDSIPDSDFINIMLNEYQKIETREKLALIGPSLYDPRSKAYHGFHQLGKITYSHVSPEDMLVDTIECLSVNSSGSFGSIDVFKKVGYYDEDLFIDHVETEWCFRAIEKGYHFYGTKKTKIKHHMGKDVLEYSLFGTKINLPYRTPLRHQYLFRNSIFLIRKSYVPFVWKFYCFVKLVLTFTLFGFFTKESVKHRQSILRGLKSAFNNEKGKIEL